MRRTRRLFLLAIIAILGSVGFIYQERARLQKGEATLVPKVLPPDTNSTREGWSHSWTTADGRPKVEVRARNLREVKDSSTFELEDVDIRLYDKDGEKYDHVKSARADFDVPKKIMHSEGDVEITMSVPEDEPPTGKLIVIRSSGVTFDCTSGKAVTDRLASFGFDRGEGHAVGASYDPTTGELHMQSQVELIWRGDDPASKPMKIQSGELMYNEKQSKVFLAPWARLTRDTLTLEAANGAVVTLEKGDIKLVEAENAKGADTYPARQIEYAADKLTMLFGDFDRIEKITGVGNAKLISASAAARTTLLSDHVDLVMDTSSGESTLRQAMAMGHSVAESKPVPQPGVSTPATKIMRSDTIEIAMQPGGKEIKTIDAHAPGTLEFLPNRPDDHQRKVDAERMGIVYGTGNQLQSLHAVNVTTRTEGVKKGSPPTLTTSKGLSAEFEPKGSQIRKLEQWDDFRYQQGDRHGRAEHATLDSPTDMMILDGKARVWDPTGSADANQIRMQQKTGDFVAEGKVTSTRAPDKKGASSAMLSQDEAVQSKADRMASKDQNMKLTYEGNVVLWQGANRLTADRVEVDREEQQLRARGHVYTEFVDKPKTAPNGKPAPKASQAAVYTTVRAPEMDYADDDRIAHYRGGVVLKRPNMNVTAKEIKAYLRDQNADSSLDKAYADGTVEILQNAPGRTRKGTAEHAEYEVTDEKIILHGGTPVFVDSNRGTTKGEKLTYYSNDDRLLVNGEAKKPAESRINRKKK